MSTTSTMCYSLPMQRSRTAPAAARYTLDLSSPLSHSISRSRRARADARPSLAPFRSRAENKPTPARTQPHHTREPAPTEADPLPSPTIDNRANWPHVRAPPPGTGLIGNLPDLTDLAMGRAFVVLATAGMHGLTGDNGGHGAVNPWSWAARF
ncbi:hypothetical protein PENSPDRAFT_690161 [Peniophora sp. CONT]|nr:hypothetical protein PENSPDRAFT_690161 [Peniophora sp. CONT]